MSLRNRLLPLLVAIGFGVALSAGCSDDPDSASPDAAPPGVDAADAAPLDAGWDGGDPFDGGDPPSSDVHRGDPVNLDGLGWDFGNGDGDGGAPDLQLSKVSPNHGPVAGGTKFVVEGRGFTRDTELYFGSREANVRVIDGKLVGQTPLAPNPGKVTVKALDPSTGEDALPQGFSYNSTLRLDAVVPNEIPVDGGFQVTLRGAAFTKDTRVSFDGKTALQHAFVDAETMRVTAPSNSAGPADLRLTNRTATLEVRGAVDYVEPLEIDRVRPAIGPTMGAAVVLHGRGFEPGMTATFGGRSSTVSTVGPNGTQAMVNAPAHAPGLVDVSARTPSTGSDIAEDAFYYRPSGESFKLAGIYPNEGSRAGGTKVTLVGPGLNTSNLNVKFGTKTATLQSTGTGFAVVSTPAHQPGRVDVTVEDGTGKTSTINNGFEYLRRLRLDSVRPSSGKAAGGKVVTLKGTGFNDADEVRFGGVRAPFTVKDDSTIEVTTPAHAPGSVDVRIEDGDRETTKKNAFTYTEKLDVFGHSPVRGSIAGNTYVVIRGRGFTGSKLDATFDGTPAASVRAIDSQTLAVRTPPHTAGTVELRVTRGNKAVKSPADFTYFDPSSRNGGTWGGPVKGSVNVAVYSDSGGPLKGAFVMLSTNPKTKYTGRTDNNGLVTLSGPDVFGDQTVTATAANFSTTSIQQVNAANITVFLTRLSQPSTPPPQGRDAGMPTNSDAMTVDTEMPDSDADAGGNPSMPTNPTPDASDDPNNPDPPPDPPDKGPPVFEGQLSGLDKLGVPGPDERHLAVVYTTRETPWSRLPPPGPGNRVREDGRYWIETRTGDLALVAVGGLINVKTGKFKALAMGVKRYQFATRGNRYKRDIKLDIPLDRTLTYKIHNPPFHADGPDINRVQPYLDFGLEGVFGQLKEARGATSLIKATGYPSLQGKLSGVTVTTLGGSYTALRGSALGIPLSVAVKEGVSNISNAIAMPKLIGAPIVTAPMPGTRPTNDIITFSPTSPIEPDYYRVEVYTSRGKTVWEAYIPGTATTVHLPTFPSFSSTPQHRRPNPYPTGRYQVQILGIRHPNSRLNNFSYTDLSVVDWTAYTLNASTIIF